ncbi:hypothetical protein FHW96_001443 [Novosphingobium sp. SG751A]|uniref:hypothetical protein n=1 Tax=Novosphingobium sp. SG751A TaxID=2587000 RepID=UPI001555A412|nr:hypothetical protein [Novosphingobium sp. SG751A]NOW45288.1 hypothetical protein [Novosphingobium sp. SG751A]
MSSPKPIIVDYDNIFIVALINNGKMDAWPNGAEEKKICRGRAGIAGLQLVEKKALRSSECHKNEI